MSPEEKNTQSPEPQTAENPLETLVNKEHSPGQDGPPKKDIKKPEDSSRLHRLKHWYATHKKISIPLSVLVVLLIVAAIPWTRYASVGLVYKKDFTLQLKDSTAHTPVSGALVSMGAATATTDGNGNVTLPGVKVGNHKVSISKKYYQDSTVKVLVPILNQKKVPSFDLVATGRQAKVLVSNIISGEKLEGVEITAADSEATTDDKGSATVVVPAGAASQKATLSLVGYNEAEVTIEASANGIKENNFKLTPEGRIYFMSKRTGKLDVMKVNLDGSDAKVAVAGTGTEQESNTKIMQSPDGKHVALLAKRSNSDPTAQLYVISADDDKLTSADTGNAEFAMVGWAGSRLVYTVSLNDLPASQAGKSKLKSYDAATGKLTALDQSDTGDPAIEASQRYDLVRLSGDSVVFAKSWFGNTTLLTGKQDSFHVISANGQNHKSLATYDTTTNYMDYTQHSPVGFYIRQYVQASQEEKFFDYVVGSSVKPASINITQFYEKDLGYYFSPSGKQTMWAEERDGKNTFLIADSTGNNAKAAAELDEHNPEGWYSDQYLLLSKKSSELYIMGVKGGEPLKVTNYQSTYNFY